MLLNKYNHMVTNKETSSAYTTNTTGKRDAPLISTALVQPQRRPRNKGEKDLNTKTIDWLIDELSEAEAVSGVTEPKI